MLSPVVFDTESEQMLVHLDLVSHSQLLATSHRLCGITGECTELSGPVNVNLQFGEREESFAVYMADTEDPCILGIDYLASHKSELDFRAMQMTIGRNKVPLRAVNRDGLTVMVRSTTVTSLKSSMLFLCQNKGLTRARLGLVEQGNRCTIKIGVTVGRTLVDPVLGEVSAVVANFFLRPRKVKKGPVIGLLQEVYQNLQSCACRRSLMKFEGELPGHLQDFFYTELHLSERVLAGTVKGDAS